MFVKKVLTLAFLDFFQICLQNLLWHMIMSLYAKNYLLNIIISVTITNNQWHDNELVSHKWCSKYNYFGKYYLSSVYPVLRPVIGFRINISYSDAKNQDKVVEIFIFLFSFILDYVIWWIIIDWFVSEKKIHNIEARFTCWCYILETVCYVCQKSDDISIPWIFSNLFIEFVFIRDNEL